MVQVLKASRTVVLATILLLTGGWSAAASAASVRFVGSVGYSHIATIVLLTADQVHNFDAAGTSGALRIELWATPTPFAGSFTGGYQLASYPLSALAGGATLANIASGVLPFTSPPSGIWYVAVVLTEQTGAGVNGGFSADSYVNFPDRISGSGAPPPPPPPDTTPPTVGITSPSAGNVSGTVTIAASASDNVGVTHVDFYVNGALVGSDSAAPYQYSWNTTSLANGAASLRAIAFDAAGNSGQSSVSVTVANGPPPDTTPPIVAIASPVGGNVSGTVAIAANASDNVGVTRVDFYVNGAMVGSANASPWQFLWNTTSVANGAATLRAVAYDAAGNSGNSSNVSVTVANVVTPPPPPPPDSTPPTAAIASPLGGSVSGMVAIQVTASDNVGVTRVDLVANGQVVATDNGAPWQFSWNSASVANGSATLRAVAYDAAGNSGTSSIVTVTVANVGPPPPTDAVPPTVAIASPTAGSVSGIVNVMVNASDNVGVTRVDLVVEGQIVATDSAAPWQFSWNSISVANGAVHVQAVAHDAAGNTGTSSVVLLTIANAGTPPPIQTGYAIEFYNAALSHYFITASQTEVDVLDSGGIAGWTRTGLSFKVYSVLGPNASPVCRIYIPPPYGNSHFFSASPAECADAITKYPYFEYEAADVFYVTSPDAAGNCPAGDAPVYRLWDNRVDTNHRYTTSWQVREQMIAEGWVPEGYGPDAVMMCSPP
jgi:Bacterial Ig domain/Repeat of unknown function (DUF5648)